MARFVVALVLVLAHVGCGRNRSNAQAPSPPAAAPAASDRALEIARLEVERSAGVARLVELARVGGEDGALAVRALGRIGSPPARAALVELTQATDPGLRVQAIWWLGPAGAVEAQPELRRLAGEAGEAERRAAVAALGRVGAADALPLLTAALADPAVRREAALALGRLGRRQIPLDDGARAALAEATRADDEDFVQAAVFALWREHQPPADEVVAASLRMVSRSGRPRDRAMAVAALARRARGSFDKVIAASLLRDEQWLVQVEAVRALAAMEPSEDEASALAVSLVRLWARMVQQPEPGPEAHVIVEGLAALVALARVEAVSQAAAHLRERALGRLRSEAPGWSLAASTIHCHAERVLAAAGGSLDDLARCGGDPDRGMPAHARAQLLGSALGDRGASPAVVARVETMGRSADPRVRAVAVQTAGELLDDLGQNDRDADRYLPLTALIGDALASDEPVLVDAAAGAIAGLVAGDDPAAAELVPALVERVRTVSDPELRNGLVQHLVTLAPEAVLPLCRALQRDPQRTVREQARSCITAITSTDPGELQPEAEAAPPPVEPWPGATPVRWSLETTRGTIVVELDPQLARWHVGSIVALTERGFYDGTVWHRVVPGFVIQGGDPTGTGWAGPGYTLPAEPSNVPYERGTVGIADAGLDTGGSQFFVTHARQPHLDGRYTVVGRVVEGMGAVDAILVGDRIVRARIER